jgi:hypothetical protein
MGEGSIDIRQIRGWVEAAGFHGFCRWRSSPRSTGGDQNDFPGSITRAFREHVQS